MSTRIPMTKSGFCAFPGVDDPGHKLCSGKNCTCDCHTQDESEKEK